MENKKLSDYERTGKIQRKIDIYVSKNGVTFNYLWSTAWWRTQRDAIEQARAKHGANFFYKASWGEN